MPKAIGNFVAKAAITAITGGEAGPLTFGMFVLKQAISFAVSSIVTVGIGAAARAIAGGGLKTSNLSTAPAFSQFAQNRTLTMRQPVARRRAAFGMTRLNGVLSFADSTKTSTIASKSGEDQYFHRVVTTLGHPIKGCAEWIVEDEYVTVDSSGVVTSGKYKSSGSNKPLMVFEGCGTTAGDATLHSKLRANSSEWTVNHKQTGCAKFYSQFEYDRDVYTGALPNVSQIARCCDTVYDPRDQQEKYTNNAALCILAYILNNDFGLGDELTRVDVNSFITAANICEEQVPVEISRTFTVDIGTDIATLDISTIGLATGDKVKIESTGTPPAPLVVGTDYYWIVDSSGSGKFATSKENALADIFIDLTNTGSGTHTLKRQQKATFTVDLAADVLTLPEIMPGLREGNGVEIETTGTAPGNISTSTLYYWIYNTHKSGKLATSYANAMAGIAVDISSVGSGTHTLVRKSEARYTLNGVFEYSDDPFDDLEELLTSCGGFLTDPGGIWTIKVAAWTAPTVTLTQDEIDGDVEMTTQVPVEEKYNRVRGLMASPEDLYQPVDYPMVKNSVYEAEDKEPLPADRMRPFTDSLSTCQRLAKIEIEQTRQQIACKASFNLFALQLQPGSVFNFTYPFFGFDEKTFEVKHFLYSARGSEDNSYLGCDLKFRETAAAVFDWNSGEETAVDLAPNTSLPNVRDVNPPTNLVLSSGTDDLLKAGDGTIISRIKATFTDGDGAFITHTEFQFKKSSDSKWINAPAVDRGIEETYLSPVLDGVEYDVRARSVNSAGVRSDKDDDTWTATVTNHLVIGKKEKPSDVLGFSAQQTSQGMIAFGWGKIADSDRNGYTIKRTPRNAPLGWDDSMLVTEEERGTEKTSASVPPGDWRFYIKAIDTSGNESVNVTSFDLVVKNSNNIIQSQVNHSRWPGIKVGLIYHAPSGKLIPKSKNLASVDGVFSQMGRNPVDVAYYEGLEIDLGFDSDKVRVFADIQTETGPGQTGSGKADLQIDYKDNAGSYDGFEVWPLGEADFRYLKGRAVLDTSIVGAALTAYTLTADTPENESIHTEVTIPPGGKTILFTRTFHQTPSVKSLTAKADGINVRIPNWKNVTTTQADIHVFDKDGSDVGGEINVTFVGP